MASRMENEIKHFERATKQFVDKKVAKLAALEFIDDHLESSLPDFF
jgi:hypothetical protein